MECREGRERVRRGGDEGGGCPLSNSRIRHCTLSIVSLYARLISVLSLHICIVNLLMRKKIISMQKSKEIVFYRLSLRTFVYPVPVYSIEQVASAKLLGITLHECLRADVSYITAPRMYLCMYFQGH